MSSTAISFYDSRWSEFGDAKFERTNDGRSITILSGPKTDWWRTAIGSEPESGVNRTSGPLISFTLPADATHWTVSSWINGDFDERFKQAEIFIGVGEFDQEGQWLKAGLEVEHDTQFVASVVTAPFADWAILKSPKPVAYNQHALFIQAKRTGADIILAYALSSGPASEVSQAPDDSDLILIREVKGFAATAPKGKDWHIGAMVCGPLSETTKGTFTDFSLKIDGSP